MKKIISLALATAMVFAMSAAAFAAGSIHEPTVSGSTSTGTSSLAVSSGFDVNDGVNTTEAVSEAATKANTAGYDSYIVYALDIDFVLSDSSATVSVKIDGINAGDSVTVLHYKNGGWVQEDAEVDGNGYVVISNLTTASPFMIIKDTTVASTTTTTTSGVTFSDAYGYWDANGEFVWYGYWENGAFIYTTDPSATTAAAVTSPVTGEGNVVAVAMSVMLLAGVAAYGVVRKKQN